MYVSIQIINKEENEAASPQRRSCQLFDAASCSALHTKTNKQIKSSFLLLLDMNETKTYK